MCFGCSKNRLIETVLLSTHNICFGLEIRKIIFSCALLSDGLTQVDAIQFAWSMLPQLHSQKSLKD